MPRKRGMGTEKKRGRASLPATEEKKATKAATAEDIAEEAPQAGGSKTQAKGPRSKVSWPATVVLAYLLLAQEEGRAVSAYTVAKETKLRYPSVHLILTRLEKAGYLREVEGPKSRRFKPPRFLTLTEKGRLFAAKALYHKVRTVLSP